jgi:hypothetical protein
MQYKAENRRRQRTDSAHVPDPTKHTHKDVAMIRNRRPKAKPPKINLGLT